MSALSKLNLKAVKKHTGLDPRIQKRRKLLTALEVQKRLVEAELKGKEFTQTKRIWVKDDAGQQVPKDVPKRIRAWYFEQDTGWYVQCRYGAKVINLAARNNSVFVNKKSEIPSVFDALITAVDNGELDTAIEAVSPTRRLVL